MKEENKKIEENKREQERLERERQRKEMLRIRLEELRQEEERIQNEKLKKEVNNKYDEIKNYLPDPFYLDEYKLIKLKNSNKDRCSICLENFIDKVQCLYLPCMHLFHSICIMHWLLEHEKCPECNLNYKGEPNYTSNNNINLLFNYNERGNLRGRGTRDRGNINERGRGNNIRRGNFRGRGRRVRGNINERDRGNINESDSDSESINESESENINERGRGNNIRRGNFRGREGELEGI